MTGFMIVDQDSPKCCYGTMEGQRREEGIKTI